MPENRSCPEFILNPLLVTEFKLAVNCANCKRWLPKSSKCREMIWVKEWVEWMAGDNVKPKCKYYSPITPGRKYCANCSKGIGVWCEEYLTLYKEYETTRKFKALDIMMRSNRGISGPV